MRKTWRILLIGCGSLLVLAAVGGASLSWTFRPQPPESELPGIVRGLPSEYQKAQLTFQQRVQTRFVPGTNSPAMLTALQQEGFVIHDKGGVELATVEQRGFPCVRDWTIAWRGDEAGKIRDIRSSYYLGCL